MRSIIGIPFVMTLCLLLLLGCTGSLETSSFQPAKEQDKNQATNTTEESLPEPDPLETSESEESIDEVREQEQEELPENAQEIQPPSRTLSSVSCEGDALSFTITNVGEYTWSLDTLSFPSPQGIAMARVIVNSRDVWNINGSYSGSNDFTRQSLRDCTDSLISPGESVSCTIGPIPYRTPSSYSQNSILVSSHGVFQEETFIC